MIALWAHQAAAADAACTELAAGGRATIVAPCGTGKTRTAAEVSRRLTPAGRVLAAVTTPAALAHTAREWRRWLGPAAGHLITIGDSDEDGGDRPTGGTSGPPAQIVTSPAALAQRLSRGQRVSVICAHASLPIVAAAHRDHGAPAWDLLIAGDAHHTAHPPAAALHHGELIPAARRLYLTATPHILDGKGANLTGLGPAVSGAIVHRLPYAAATEMGILARYRVAAALITTAEATAVTGGVRRYSTLRTAAAHLALARALTTWNLRRVIAYHDQTGPAQRFAATLPRALTRISPPGRPTHPVTTCQLDTGGSPLTGFPDPGAVTPAAHTTVAAAVHDLCAAPGTPAGDAVAFNGLKTPPTAVADAAGRALRRSAGAAPTVTFIIPVLLPDGPSVEQALDSPAFDTLGKVVRALRGHDEQLAAWLDHQRASQTGTTTPPWLHFLGEPATAELAAPAAARIVHTATSAWPRHYAALAEFHARHGHTNLPIGYQANGINLRQWLNATCAALRAGTLAPDRAQALAHLGVHPSPLAWQRGLTAARAYHTAHGHLRVPPGHRTRDGFALYTWCHPPRGAGTNEALGVRRGGHDGWGLRVLVPGVRVGTTEWERPARLKFAA